MDIKFIISFIVGFSLYELGKFLFLKVFFKKRVTMMTRKLVKLKRRFRGVIVVNKRSPKETLKNWQWINILLLCAITLALILSSSSFAAGVRGVLYTSPTCSACPSAKYALRSACIPFREVDVSRSRAPQLRGVPTLDTNTGQRLVGTYEIQRFASQNNQCR